MIEPTSGLEDGVCLFPTSHGQRGLWFVDQLEGPSPVYNVPAVIKCSGKLYPAHLRGALTDLIDRHEILRTAFVEAEGEPFQLIEDSLQPPLDIYDLTNAPEPQRNTIVHEKIKTAAEELFDLNQAPLWRVRVVKTSPDESFLCFVFHHSIADGMSLPIFLRDLATIYEARLRREPPSLPELPIQFADFACWEAETLDQPYRQRLLRYWQDRLRNLPDLSLPIDFPRPAQFTYRGGCSNFLMDEACCVRLETLAHQAGATVFVAYLAALEILLSEWTGQTDIPVGVPTANRDRPELRELIGFFVNTLVVRGSVSPQASFRSHLSSLHAAFQRDLAHSQLPFELLTQALVTGRNRSRHPLFQVMFAFQREPEVLPALPGLSWEPIDAAAEVAHFDLHFEIVSGNKKRRLNIEYCSDLFSAATITKLATRLQELIGMLIREPDRPLQELVEFKTDSTSLRENCQGTVARRTISGKIPASLLNLPAIVGAASNFAEWPLSLHQERIWFTDLFEAGTVYPSHPTYYNLPVLLEVAQSLDRQILSRSLRLVARRHEILRARLVVRDGLARQAVAEDTEIPLAQLPNARNREEAICSALDFARQPFNLEVDLLFRAGLVTFADQRELLVIVTHHFVADKRSLELIARDLAAIYEAARVGEEPSPPPVSLRYRDYVLWQRSLSDEALEKLRTYWTDRLAGPLGVLELPTDRPRHAVHLYRQEYLSFSIEPTLQVGLNRVAATLCTSLEALLLTGFQSLLFRYSRQNEIVIGLSELAGQPLEAREIVGPVANLVVLRQRFSDLDPFSAMVTEVGRQLDQARCYGAMPFDLLVQALNPTKDMSRTALFDVLFRFDDREPAPIIFEQERATWIDTHLGFGKYDLNLYLCAQENGITGMVVFNGELFDPDTVNRMLRHFRCLLRGVVSNPDLPVADIPLLSSEEEIQIVETWNETAAAYPQDQTIHGLFEAQAARAPDRIAVRCEDRQLTYRALEAKANRLAHVLQRLGVRRDRLVAVCLGSSEFSLVAFLAVLKAGGAYLPIDPEYPEPRIRFILEDAEVEIIIGESNRPLSVTDGFAHRILLDRNSPWFPGEPESPPVNLSAPGDLAYCIYTSGSTGKPKGVLVEHRNVLRLVVNERLPFDFEQNDVWTLFHSTSFDFSVWEMYGALFYGGCVVVVPRSVAQDPRSFLGLLESHKVTILNQTPTAFYHLADEALCSMPKLSLRYVIFGGEALNPRRLLDFNTAYPHVALINMYGITETTVHVTYKELTRDILTSGISNVGRPIPTATCYILDEQGRPVPPGIPGEIYVGGDGVCRGYLKRNTLTRERFLANRFRPGKRLYRSGDLGKYLSNGDIIYLGRLDAQVQVRGFRVEPSEIQTRLLEHPSVRDAMVTARPLNDGSLGIFAYVVTKDAEPLPDLRRHLSETLPDYMIPAMFIALDSLPMTSNGKLDSGALPDPRSVRQESERSEQPLSAVERRIAKIWSSVLGCGQVRPDDDFFGLGGYSLLATRLLANVRQDLGADVPLRVLFESSRLRDFARRAEAFLPSEQSARNTPLIRLSRDGDLPASSTQTRLWFIHRLNNQPRAYHLFGAAKLRGEVDWTSLRRALTEVQSRHESLRTSFHEREHGLRMEIRTDLGIPLPVADLSRFPERERESAYRRLAVALAQESFDLESAPLVRVQLFYLNAQDTRLVVGMHHIIADGWSLDIFQKEIVTLYEAFRAGRPSSLKELPFQFCDLADWQARCLTPERKQALLKFWTLTLQEVPPLEMPTDRPRPPVGSDQGGFYPFVLEPGLAEQIRTLALAYRASPFMVCMAGFQLLLARYSGQNDFAVGFPVSNRSRLEAQAIIGCFVNTLALRAQINETDCFGDLVHRVRDRTLAAHAHQDLPFDQLVDALNPPRNLSGHPIFQVLFNFQEPLQKQEDHCEVLLEAEPLDVGATQFDLALYLEDRPSDKRFDALFVYRSDLFAESTIRRFSALYRQILVKAVADAQRPLAEFDLLTAEETQEIRSWNVTDSPGDVPQFLHQLFERQASRTPGAVAVEFENSSLTYAELDRKASRLAVLLRKTGIGTESVVGVCMERSLEMIVSLLGVLKAGAAYLPVDPELPPKRICEMLEIAGATLTVTLPDHQHCLAASAVPPLLIDLTELESVSETALVPPIHPLNTAYLIFTSGSTGAPKGVMIPHGGICNRLLWMQEAYGLDVGDRVLQKSPFTFDVSLWDIFWPLIAGARLIIAKPGGHRDPGYLVKVINERRITTLHFVPSMLEAFLHYPGAASCSSLRRVICSGEALSKQLAKRFFAIGLQANLYNLYGPTEASVDVTAWQCKADEGTIIPIGRPISNIRLHILDSRLRQVPVGAPGELYIAGVGLARGYCNRPGLTAASFVPDPFSSVPGARLYRTGDRARYLNDGAVEFLGRFDDQVKVRGMRIELGEIEARLSRQHAVREAAVAIQPKTEQMIAYVVPETPVEDPESFRNGVIRLLQAELPLYMVPADVVILDRLPVTRHGKLDRTALPERLPRRRSDQRTRSETEKAIAEVWGKVLSRDQIDTDETFFDAGGHSLLLVRAHLLLCERFGSSLELADLFRFPTISSLARFLDGEGSDQIRLTSTPAPVGNHQPTSPQTARPQDIAIIGLAGRFPGARDLDHFWENISAGNECIHFFSRSELVAAGMDEHTLDDPSFVPAAGILDDFQYFDADYFGYSPGEAMLLDPQARVFLECAAEALQSAGYDSQTARERIGVFGGSSLSTYGFMCVFPRMQGQFDATSFSAIIGNDKDYLTTRISYKLGLRGPSIAVQTACSTSLVAVHLACQSLRAGECEMALAGGVSIAAGQKPGYLYQQEGILSPDGHCRAFDSRAAGTVMGSGCGIVLLKPLRQALLDGDPIHAVIKGTAMNNDGAAKVGYTAPGVDGQISVLQAAFADANVNPDSVRYIETHGTGTPLGDLVEISALKRVFEALPEGHCAIGSVKTNLGHLDAAAGIAGLIKTVLALKNQALPPSLHCDEPNPKLGLRQSPFFVNRELRPWIRGGAPRRAGVSSFGIGGSNAHIILEEAPERPATANNEVLNAKRGYQLLTVSARSPEALSQWANQLSKIAEASGQRHLEDFAFTLQVGRPRLPCRFVAVIRSFEEAAETLCRCSAATDSGAAARINPTVAFLFPGQGTQQPGMGAELYNTEPLFREAADQCLNTLPQDVGAAVFSLFFEPGLLEQVNRGAQQSDLAQRSDLVQSGLFIFQYAMASLWGHWGVRPQKLLGHSLGEYAAACLAGVFSPEDAVRLAAKRGRLIEDLPGGAMLAVALPEAELLPQLPEELDLSAVNGPRLCVVSGPLEAVQDWSRFLKSQQVPSKILSVNRAFHSRAMEPAGAPLREAVAALSLQPPKIPFVSNVTGTWALPEEATSPDFWVRHLREPVRFWAGLEALAKDPEVLLLEIGPGDALAKIVQSTKRGHQSKGRQRAPDEPYDPLRLPVIAVAPEPGTEPRRTLLKAAGSLWLSGVNLNWPALHMPHRPVRIPLPTYPFQRKRFWIEDHKSLPDQSVSLERSARSEASLYVPVWTRASLPVDPSPSTVNGQDCLLFVPGESSSQVLTSYLEGCGARILRVQPGFRCDPHDFGEASADIPRPESFDSLFSMLQQRSFHPSVVVYAWDLADDRPNSHAGYYGLLRLAQALAGQRRPSKLLVLTCRATTACRDWRPEGALARTLALVIGQEFPHIDCHALDVESPEIFACGESCIRWVRHALAGRGGGLAFANGTYWEPNYLPVVSSASAQAGFRESGTYLITGGLGNIGKAIARELARRYHARLFLCGRRSFPQQNSEQLSPESRFLEELVLHGSEVCYESVDLSKPAAARQAVQTCLARFGKIHGVIHAAGVAGEDAWFPLSEAASANCERVFLPKTIGTATLIEALEGISVDFFVACSSLSTVLGGLGFGAYAAANAYMDALIEAQTTRSGRWISIDWDGWDFADNSGSRGQTVSLAPEAGVRALEAILATDRVGRLLAVAGDLQPRLEKWVRSLKHPINLNETAPVSDPQRTANLDPPRNWLEREIAEIWQELLGLKSVGIHDDFLDLGGHSLMATQMIARLSEKLSLQLSLRAILEAPTVAQLARVIESMEPKPYPVTTIEEREEGEL